MDKTKITKIYVIRHGQSESNVLLPEEKVTSADHIGMGSPLTKLGIEQANKLGEALKDIEISAVYSSDLLRAKQTAQILAKKKNLEIKTSPAIRENSFYGYVATLGDKRAAELEEEIHEQTHSFSDEEKMKYKHSDAMESAEEAALRFLNFLKKVAMENIGKVIFVVAHGNIMRSLLTCIGFARFDELPAGSIENTAYFVVETNGDNFAVIDAWGIHKQKGTFRAF